MVQLTIAIIFIVLIASYNGYILRWALNGLDKTNGKIWHGIGLAIRIVVFLMIYTNVFSNINIRSIILSIAIGFISWMPYDSIINYITFKTIFYDASDITGTTSKIDIVLNNWKYYVAQVIAMAVGIIILIIYK